MVNEVTPLPPANMVPPVEVEYQSIVAPADAEAPIISGPSPLLALSSGVLAVGKLLTVIATGIE